MTDQGPPTPFEDSPNYLTPNYEADKASGRRRPSGALNLQRLKPKHYRIIKLHLQGIPNVEIADAMHMTQAQISIILNDPKVREIVSSVQKDWENEFYALEGKAVAAVRNGLSDDDPKNSLRAANIFFGEKRARQQDSGGPTSAEDVIQQMLDRATNIENLNIQINQGGKD